MKKRILVALSALAIAMVTFGFVAKTQQSKIAECPSCPDGTCCTHDCCK